MCESRAPTTGLPHTSRYRVRVLEHVELTPEGVCHGAGGERCVLAWSRVERALSAEIGEPEGVRTVVFDLVVGRTDAACEVYRFDADPYDAAMAVARSITRAIGSERTLASIKSVATDGTSSRCYPDLDAFAAAALEELAAGEL